MSALKPLKESIINKKSQLGWIGTGVMGQPMCGHLTTAGYAMKVFTRTPSRLEPLLGLGAKATETIAALAESCDVIFTMVGFPSELRQVFDGDGGILHHARPGTVLVDMTTTEPSLTLEMARNAGDRGLFFLDAPVSGGDVGARNATLSIMVGGDAEAFDTIQPLFQLMGRQIVLQGPAGSGQHTKMCNQIVIASTMIGVCESLLYGQRAGLNMETVLESISGGAAGCWTLSNLAPRILQRNFDPGFFVEHFVKDMGIALKEAKAMGLALRGLELGLRLYEKTVELGHGRLGTHALMLALEALHEEKARP